MDNQRQHNAKLNESVDMQAQNAVRSAVYLVVRAPIRRGALFKLDFNSRIPVLTVSSVLGIIQ